jgi:hypothetical protein
MVQSEIAQLRAQIEAEYEAAERGLQGVAYGTAQHQFITAGMEAIAQCCQRLREVANHCNQRAGKNDSNLIRLGSASIAQWLDTCGPSDRRWHSGASYRSHLQ